jgi:hypothetical protein
VHEKKISGARVCRQMQSWKRDPAVVDAPPGHAAGPWVGRVGDHRGEATLAITLRLGV